MTAHPAERPWPVVLLTALGAWLATLPLAGVVGLLLGDLLVSGIGPYLVGPLLLVGAGVVLRAQGVGPFVEQLAVPMLLLGGVTLGFGLYRDMAVPGASLVLAAVALGVAALIRGAWLQALLGACAVGLLLAGVGTHGSRHWGIWLVTQVAVLLWTVLSVWTADRRSARTLDAIGTGWILATLAASAAGSGMTFLVGAVVDAQGGLGSGGFAAVNGWWSWQSWASVALAAAAGALLWMRRPAMQRPWWAGAMAVGLVLAGFMPWLGAVWWVAAWCITAQQPKRKRAVAAGLAAVWIVGAFYYALDWPLTTKAAVLAGTGAGLGLLAWWGLRTGRAAPIAAATPGASSPDRARLGIVLSAVAVLVTANGAIWQKEDLIAHGRPVFIELAPVDPRSLMQGDYMALNYRLGDTLRGQLDGADRLSPPQVLARVDARGVAQLERLLDTPPGAALPADTLRIALAPKDGRWVVVTDAWFFREGDGQRWQTARYGEFRVQPDGRALLVGLVDAALQPIRPAALNPAASAPQPPAASPAPVPPASGG
ncbi:MAG: hypothetical protein RLZZ373_969 [Pseudomonadota bacterium]|jgi:uncharacterized membrane-anchored protein